MGHHDAAEIIYKIIEEKFSKTSGFQIDQLVPSAIALYLTALECYMNEHLGKSFEFLVNSPEKIHFFPHLPQNQNDLAEHIEAIRSEGLSDKFLQFYDFYGISHFKKTQLHQNLKALTDLRHEIIHYFPYMTDNNYCRSRIKVVLDLMKIEFDSSLRWYFYMADFRVLKWCKENVTNFSIEMEKIGFEPIDRVSFMKKLKSTHGKIE